MATNTGSGYRNGAVRGRSQVKTPGGYRKRDAATGRFVAGKKDGSAFKGVRRE
ncbi:hypothetical protein J6C36_01090 [Methanocorpusculaceae archaeon]|nr:hypothetical protein [Methanocorpusculaceae archaeon]MBO5367351.1 hypothetical protein [Methanocorpusculum sp.]MBO5407915.1 hypothetical protein [Clostridia bacterium]